MKTICKFLFAGALAVSTFAAHAAQISTDYDHAVNFSTYKTYSWAHVSAGDGLWEDRIRQDIDSQLAAKGWTKVSQGGDAVLTAFQSTKDQKTLDTFYNGFGGGGWGWRGFGGAGFNNFGNSITTTMVTQVGTLVVDVFDSKNHKLIWRGTQSDALSNNPEKNAEQLGKDIQKLFRAFPPK
ncbi:DUF4136 domain-containing protein [Terriglobus tenax]|uniref:DUF4136 domain-containing protein n=1 Tax=Terriglobus tenax TaxID=1111115 RepID=UPI0021E006AD|nr:DUF4136 domain-containing protein [Terriglobus tenax]